MPKFGLARSTALLLCASLAAACGSTNPSPDGGGGSGGGNAGASGRGGASGGRGGDSGSGGDSGGGGGSAGASGTTGGSGGASGGSGGASGGSGGASGGSGGASGGSGGASGGSGGASAGSGGASAGAGGGSGGASGSSGGASAGSGGATGGGSGAGGATAGSGGASAGAGGGSAGTTGGAGGGAGGTGGTAPAHAFQFGPAVSSRASGALDVFGLGIDGVIYMKSWGAGGWSTWAPITNGTSPIVSDFDTASWDGSRIDVFGLGANQEVYQAYFVGTWTTWGSLTPGTAFSLGTATSTPSQNRLWLFATGVDTTLWSRYWGGTAWTAWTSLGGGLTSPPDSTSRPNRTWVVVRGTENAIWVIRNDGNVQTGWSAYMRLPSLAGGIGFTSGPCITNWSDTRIDVFARGGTANSLWHTYSDNAGSTWVAPNWEDLGGGGMITGDAPDCVAWGNNRVDVVARGANGHILHRWWNGTIWDGWADLGVY